MNNDFVSSPFPTAFVAGFFAVTVAISSSASAADTAKSLSKQIPDKGKITGNLTLPSGKQCIIVGLVDTHGEPGCTGCGPDAPPPGPPAIIKAKAAAKQPGEKGYAWTDQNSTYKKQGEIYNISPPETPLDLAYHVVGAVMEDKAGKKFANCAAAKTYLTTDGQSFVGKMKYVLVVEVDKW